MAKHDSTEKRLVYRFADLQRMGIFSNWTTCKRWCRSGDFPRPLRLSSNSIGWKASEVEAWLESRERIA